MPDTVDRRPISPSELAAARRYALVIEWSDEDVLYLASAPDLPGLVTHGRTRAEAAEMGEEAVAVWLTAARRSGETVPDPAFSALPDHVRSAVAASWSTGPPRSA